MKVDGKIVGLEVTALKAFFYLSIGLIVENSEEALLATKAIEPDSDNFKPFNTFSPEETVTLLNMLRRAKAALLSMTWQERNHLGVTPLRLRIFNTVVQDIKSAIDTGEGLHIGYTDIANIYPHDDRSGESELAALLERFNLTKGSESANGILGGKVVDYGSDPLSDSLVIYYLDYGHTTPLITQRIRQGLLGLYEHGVEVYGKEGFEEEFEITQTQKLVSHFVDSGFSAGGISLSFEPKRCGRKPHRYISELDRQGIPVTPDFAMECLLGTNVLTMGVESDDFHEKYTAYNEAYRKAADVAGLYKAAIMEYELHMRRGYEVPENFLNAMDQRLLNRGAMVFGAAHAHEIRESLEGLGVNFIFVEVGTSVWGYWK